MFSAILVSLMSIQLVTSQTCGKLSISSDSNKYLNDMAIKGHVIPKWQKNSNTPIVIGPSKQIDYIYFIMENSDSSPQLNDDNFIINFSNHEFAKTKIVVDKTQYNDNKYLDEYAVEIKYRCNDYGGAIIDYDLEVTVPHCGKAHIFWKKLCGDPILTREGLYVDLVDKEKKINLIQDGSNSQNLLYNKDIENYIQLVPAEQNEILLQVYMNMGALKPQDLSKLTGDELVVAKLREQMRSVPKTKYSPPKIDSDEAIVQPYLKGDMSRENYIGEQPSNLIISFECKNLMKQSMVELTIPLDYFKDVSLFFLKECQTTPQNIGHIMYHALMIVAIWGIYLTSCFTIYKTIQNIFMHRMRQDINARGYDAIPGFMKTLNYFSKYQFVRQYYKNIYVDDKQITNIDQTYPEASEQKEVLNTSSYGSL